VTQHPSILDHGNISRSEMSKAVTKCAQADVIVFSPAIQVYSDFAHTDVQTA
jgi:hypothetical protein